MNPRSLDLNKPSMEFDSSLNQPKLEQIIIDPHTKDTYLLNLQIGSFSNGECHAYRALFSKYSEEDNCILIPSGYVTLKILNMNLHEFNLIRYQGTTAITPNSNIIRSKRTFITANLLCVSLSYMSEGSLRSILSTRPNKRLPEDFITIVLKEVLIGLRDEIHVDSNPMVHKTLNAGDIFVHIDDATKEMSIKLAFEVSVYDSEPSNCNHGEASSSSLFLNPKSISIWGAAPALELAYGNLPVRNRRDLNYIIEYIRNKMNKKDVIRVGEFSPNFVENPEKRPAVECSILYL